MGSSYKQDRGNIEQPEGVKLYPIEDEITALRDEHARLREALEKVRQIAIERMGEWYGVEYPYLPLNTLHLYDIIDSIDKALESEE